MVLSAKDYSAKDFDTILGTPSAQKLLRILACWNILSIQELKEKTLISESQIHLTLTNLIKIGIVSKQNRGIYQFSDSKVAQLLKEMYVTQIIHIVNQEIYAIEELLKAKQHSKAREKHSRLVALYSPILKSNFVFIMSSLSHQFLEAIEYGTHQG